MRIIHAKTKVTGKRNIFANVFDDENDFEGPELDDQENIEDVEEDMGEDGRQDSSAIEVDNNIANHLIAECQNCHGIFISAMLASDQVIESINGVCPLCNKETEQTLNWIAKEYPED
jgi:hypothetical protein